MNIKVVFQYGRELQLKVQPMDQVKDLKRLINKSIEYSLRNLELMYRGKLLENDEMLLHYSIHEDSTIYLFPLGIDN